MQFLQLLISASLAITGAVAAPGNYNTPTYTTPAVSNPPPLFRFWLTDTSKQSACTPPPPPAQSSSVSTVVLTFPSPSPSPSPFLPPSPKFQHADNRVCHRTNSTSANPAPHSAALPSPPVTTVAPTRDIPATRCMTVPFHVIPLLCAATTMEVEWVSLYLLWWEMLETDITFQ